MASIRSDGRVDPTGPPTGCACFRPLSSPPAGRGWRGGQAEVEAGTQVIYFVCGYDRAYAAADAYSELQSKYVDRPMQH